MAGVSLGAETGDAEDNGVANEGGGEGFPVTLLPHGLSAVSTSGDGGAGGGEEKMKGAEKEEARHRRVRRIRT